MSSQMTCKTEYMSLDQVGNHAPRLQRKRKSTFVKNEFTKMFPDINPINNSILAS